VSLQWPQPGDAATCGVIGWPVTYSLSPAIHNAAFEALGMDWTYVHLPVAPQELPEAMRRLASDGFVGANVTIPHKTQAADLSSWLSEDADILNAVNTLALVGGELTGHNTDSPGFSRFLAEDAAWDPGGRSALVFGAGGAARACALSLCRGGIARVTVVARDPARAELMVRMIEELGVAARCVPFEESPESRPDLIINATPLGKEGEGLPVGPLDPDTLVVDLLYGSSVTPLIASAAESGARTFGGLGLLVHQAALSFELWTGRVPPLEVMREAAKVAAEEA